MRARAARPAPRPASARRSRPCASSAAATAIVPAGVASRTTRTTSAMGGRSRSLTLRPHAARALEAIELGHVPVGARATAQPRRQLLDEQRDLADDLDPRRVLSARRPGRRGEAQQTGSAAGNAPSGSSAASRPIATARSARWRIASGAGLAPDQPEVQGMRIGKRALAVSGHHDRRGQRLGQGAQPRRHLQGAALASGDEDRPLRLARRSAAPSRPTGVGHGARRRANGRGQRNGARRRPCPAPPRDGPDRAARSGRAGMRGRSSAPPCPRARRGSP